MAELLRDPADLLARGQRQRGERVPRLVGLARLEARPPERRIPSLFVSCTPSAFVTPRRIAAVGVALVRSRSPHCNRTNSEVRSPVNTTTV